MLIIGFVCFLLSNFNEKNAQWQKITLANSEPCQTPRMEMKIRLFAKIVNING